MIATEYMPKIGNEDQKQFIREYVKENITIGTYTEMANVGGLEGGDYERHSPDIEESQFQFDITGLPCVDLENIDVEIDLDTETLNVVCVFERIERLGDRMILIYELEVK